MARGGHAGSGLFGAIPCIRVCVFSGPVSPNKDVSYMPASATPGPWIDLPNAPVIAIGGENLIDTVQTTGPDGAVVEAHNLGGSPYNVAVAMARQGQGPHYLTPISTDDFGDQLAAHLVANGVTLAGGRRDEPSTQAVVTLKEGIPQYVFHRDNTAERCVSAESLQMAMPEGATHLHVGSLALAGGADAAAWEAAFTAAAKAGMSTSLDPNVRASLVEDAPAYRARITRLLGHATIVKLSDEDLEWLYPDLSQSGAMEALLSATNAQLVALTQGPIGAECWTASGHFSIDNPKLPYLEDSIGAGDTFMATLVASLVGAPIGDPSEGELQGVIKRCLYAACLNCMQKGCNPPNAAQIDHALANGL